MTGVRGWRAYLPDVALAGVMAVLLVGHALNSPKLEVAPGPVDFLLIAVGVAGLAVCRRRPVTGLLVVTVAMAGYTLRVHPGPPAAFAVIAAVYLAANAGHRLLGVLASAGFLACFFSADIAAAARIDPERTMLLLGWFLAANVAGAVTRAHRKYLRAAEERAAEAERTREETALRRAGEERLRIARELHDSLTQHLDHQAAGRGRGAPGPRARRRRTRGAARDPGGERRGDAGAALHPGGAARAGRPRGRPGVGAGRADRVGGSAGRPHGRGPVPAAAGRGGPGRVPDRAGGADQRQPPRRSRHRGGTPRLPFRPAGRLGGRRRGRRVGRRGARCRADRDAGAGHGARRHAAGRSARHGRLRSARRASPGGDPVIRSAAQ